MPTEKLDKVYSTTLHSPDGWWYKVKVYEDVTSISYGESKDGEEEHLYDLTTGYDIQVCEEIIRLRKQKIADEAKT